ncbi:hypothetical protein ACX1HF_04735 [Yersinia pseudotuberculosis]|uniref:hypothetical protein n=1 Tax=Yersinia pseudotuberculosis TaxID=633 RepID=UPI0005E3200B|nr:hypothetical protein [Yersinia pseudotuberculosis]CNE05168.1 Uncharacterised protein [Yersinia pseudotuberculosis]SUQ17605.1 Uncharacterised protein [Yersinia pseudotuberculosis]
MTSRQRFEAFCKANKLCIERGVTSGDYAMQQTYNMWVAWQAAIKTPVTLPPLIDVEELEGEDLNAANHFNAAIAMCSIAIRKAGYPSECSAMFYPIDKQGG